MQITKNFKLNEFIASKQAKINHIQNIPTATEIENIINLVKRLLQPLRDLYNAPLIIHSGFRCIELNTQIGGALNSQHIKGEAADIGCNNPKELLEILQKSTLDYDQAICYPSFLHLSFCNKRKNRKEIILKNR